MRTLSHEHSCGAPRNGSTPAAKHDNRVEGGSGVIVLRLACIVIMQVNRAEYKIRSRGAGALLG